MTEKVTEEVVEEPKSTFLTVLKKEEKAIIVKINGWRMRVYFDRYLSKANKEKINEGGTIEVSYLGKMEDVHNLKLQKLKSV